MVILRDQTEENPLHQIWSNIPKWSSKLTLELRWNWPNDISLGWMIHLSSDNTTLKRMNPDNLGLLLLDMLES